MADDMKAGASPVLAALSLPFPDSAISWRVGSTNINKQTNAPRDGEKAGGRALAYIDARDVMNRLDEVCGTANWSDQYIETEKGRIICTLSIRINGEWVAKSDGAGDSDVESEKGAISDALKRAAVKWGIGRYLYDLESPWVDLQQRGKSWVMADAMRKKLDTIHGQYVRKTFQTPTASPPDAGQREQPESPHKSGAGASPSPAPAPLTKSAARPHFTAMIEEIRACQSIAELKAWGKDNAKRVELLPKDWVPEVRKEYADMLAGFEHIAKAAAEADAALEGVR